MNENTKQTNSNKIKRDWLFIALYFVVGVALVDVMCFGLFAEEQGDNGFRRHESR